MVLLAGAFFAQRYLARGNTSVAASLFEHADGFGLHVRPAIESLGPTALRLSHDDDLAPLIEVVEYPGGEGGNARRVQRATFTGDDLVGPGETVSASEIFLVQRPSEGALGWRIVFEVGVRRWLWRPAWWWAAGTFVPAPRPGSPPLGAVPSARSEPEGKGGDDGGREVQEQGKA